MPLKSDQGVDNAFEYRRYFDTLKSEESKMQFLLMLKSRRDLHRDATATVLLPELAERWISEKWTEL
jgi:hypothetical protein